jgi:hypothetical protein
MTEPMSEEGPQPIATATAEPSLPPRRLIASLRWTADPKTGWPVGRWVLGDGPGAEGSAAGAA